MLVRTPELQAMQLDKRRNQLKQIQVQTSQQPSISTAEAARQQLVMPVSAPTGSKASASRMISELEDHIDILEDELKVAKRENSNLKDDNRQYLIDLQAARDGLDTFRERQPFKQSLTGVKQTVEVA